MKDSEEVGLQRIIEDNELLSHLKEDFDFTENKQDKFKQWLKDKIYHGLECESCGSKSWELMKELYMCTAMPVRISSRRLPSVVVICNNCGNTKLFNAVMMGITG